MFEEWIALHFPDRAKRILGRVRELHGGKLYESAFGTRMTGQGIWAQQLKQRITIARARLGLDGVRVPLRRDLFRPPVRIGDQMSLF